LPADPANRSAVLSSSTAMGKSRPESIAQTAPSLSRTQTPEPDGPISDTATSREPSLHLDDSDAPELSTPHSQSAGSAASPSLHETEQSSQPESETLSEKFARLAKVGAAHFAQQVVTCGVPTFTREMAAFGVNNLNPSTRVGLHALITAGRLLADYNRRNRLERHINESARNGHGLTKAQWDALSDADRDAMIADTRNTSSAVSWTNAATALANLSIDITGTVRPEMNDIASTTFADEVRDLVYMGMRDTMNGTFDTTTIRADAENKSKTNVQNVQWSAWWYGAMQTASSLATNGAVNALSSKKNFELNGYELRSPDREALSSGAFAENSAAVAAVRAGFNTLVETAEAMIQGGYQSNQAKGKQQPAFSTKADQVRVLDHGPARMAWNSAGTSTGLLTDWLGKGASSTAQLVLNALGQGVAFGGTYGWVNQTYQAHAGERAKQKAEAAELAARDEERGN
jgi:hypothetical protein